jgi:glutamate-1-semialdehyde 2,1-aminomutase
MSRSEQLFNQALCTIPGGVNSPVRAFKGVGGTPLFIDSAKGAFLYDIDGKEYIDYIGSWGPMILGHQNPIVMKTLHAALDKGISFGAPNPNEVALANLICELMPNIEQIRMVNSGTEATMTALRLARGYTGRDIIVKFEGCYHGHSDSLLIKAGSGALTLGQPSSPGIPHDLAKYTINLEYNNIEALYDAFAEYGDQIAAVIVEPVAGNVGCVLPNTLFLRALRQVCDNYKSVLIFDEVMTGFRVALGGAQALYNIKPDLTTLGKIIGGGLPVGAIGGKKAIMQHLAPVGPVYQAGTLSGNPLAMAAGIATLSQLKEPGFYQKLSAITDSLVQGTLALSEKHSLPVCINAVGGMFSLFFTEQAEVNSYQQVMNCSAEAYKQFFHSMLHEGVYFAPSAFESAFVSIAHTPECIERTLHAMDKTFKTMQMT